jgi:hypothetical protein
MCGEFGLDGTRIGRNTVIGRLQAGLRRAPRAGPDLEIGRLGLRDLLDARIERPTQVESTAQGAACLARIAAGVWTSQSELQKRWQLDREFTGSISADERKNKMDQWDEAISRVRTSSTDGKT